MEKGILFKNVIKGLKNCYCTDQIQKQAGFKLRSVAQPIPSLSNTVEALLILELMYGKNFYYHPDCDDFDFSLIEAFLSSKKKKLLTKDREKQKGIRVSDLAYCGIGLCLLGAVEKAKEIQKNIEQHKNQIATDQEAWPTYLLDESGDVFSTYLVVKLFNRLHANLPNPKWFLTLMGEADVDGIIINSKHSNKKYVESLVLVAYSLKFYYHETITDSVLKIINEYCHNNYQGICSEKSDVFSQHPVLEYHLFFFGHAAHVLFDYKMTFFSTIDFWNDINEEFYNSTKNIPYMLEVLKTYKADVDSYDPCSSNVRINNEIFIQRLAMKIVVHLIIYGIILWVSYNLFGVIKDYISTSLGRGDTFLEIVNEVVAFLCGFLVLGVKKLRTVFMKFVSWVSKIITSDSD